MKIVYKEEQIREQSVCNLEFI